MLIGHYIVDRGTIVSINRRDRGGGVSRITAVLGGSAGNLVEWFDWYTYSATALYFAPIFFPAGAMAIQSCYTSISAIVKAELFPAAIRTLGVALPYALANALFGGTAEYVALWFKSVGYESGFYIYASFLAAISFAVALTMRETRVRNCIETH